MNILLLWPSNPKSFSCKGEIKCYFWQTSKSNRLVFLIRGECYIISEVKTHPRTDRALWPWQAFSLHVTHYHTHAHATTTQTPHALQRYKARSDERQVYLALVSPERSKKSNTDPQEGWGFCVCGVSHFITGETCNRPRKAFEGRGGVCGNSLCGYLWCQLQYWDCGLFPGLGLCLASERETIPGLYIRSQTN